MRVASSSRRSHSLEHRFSLLHPGVLTLFFASVIVITLLSYHPAILGLSFVAAAVGAVRYLGLQVFVRLLAWLIPMAGIVLLFNTLFNRRGATELFTLYPTLPELFGQQVQQQQQITFTLESLLFGLCIALMLAAIILWFRLYQEFITTDKFLYLFAPLAPTMALSVAMVQRWIPLTHYRWQQIRTAQKALNPDVLHDKGHQGSRSNRHKQSRLGSYRSLTRSLSTLMSWSMEDAIQTADSMQARGYSSYSSYGNYSDHSNSRSHRGSSSHSSLDDHSNPNKKPPRRTSFRSFRFSVQDRISLGLIAAPALYAALSIFLSTRELAFFPVFRGADDLSPFALIAAALVMLYPVLFPLTLSVLHTGKEQLTCLMQKLSAQKI